MRENLRVLLTFLFVVLVLLVVVNLREARQAKSEARRDY